MKSKSKANKRQRPTGVAVQRVVSLRGWTFTTWKSKDPSYVEWQGVGRKNGNLEIATKEYHDSVKEAISAAKAIAMEREQANEKKLGRRRFAT